MLELLFCGDSLGCVRVSRVEREKAKSSEVYPLLAGHVTSTNMSKKPTVKPYITTNIKL